MSGRGDAISREEALQILYDFAGCIVDTPNGDYQKAYKIYRDKLKKLPPDPNAIRCEECKDYVDGQCERSWIYGMLEGDLDGVYFTPDPDFLCEYGSRRGDVDDG